MASSTPSRMRKTRWAVPGVLGLWIGVTGCASSTQSGEPMLQVENGNDGGLLDAAAGGGADSSPPNSVEHGQESGAPVNGGSNGDSSSAEPVEGGPESPPSDAGTGTTKGVADAPTGDDDGATAGCMGGKALAASDGPGVMASNEYAAVKWSVSTMTQLTGLQTTLIVPAKPTATSGTLYVWPGIQPLGNSVNFEPFGNGILQPVLSVGGTCAPGAPNDYTSWWISGQYVNVSGAIGNGGCLGGPGMDVGVGDLLDMSMTLSGTVWTQVITDRQTAKSVKFDMDLKGQGQNWATLAIEIPTALEPVSDVVFTSTKLTFAASTQASCQPSQHGPTDYFSTPYASTDGKSCCVSRVILRAQGVAATTMNGP